MKHRGNYDILSGFDYFTPAAKQIIFFLLWWLVGAVLGNLVSGIVGAILMLSGGNISQIAANPLAAMGPYIGLVQIVASLVMYIPPVMYAISVSRRNAFMHEEGEPVYKIDSLRSGMNPVLLFVMAAVATIAASFLSDSVTPLLPEISPAMKESMKMLLKNASTFELVIATVIIAPIFEELTCRGIICRGIAKNYGEVPAVLISALLFGAIHLNVTQAVPAFFLGIIFAYVYLRTGSLKLTMFMHAVNNSIAVITTKCCPALQEVDSLSDILAPWQLVVLLGAATVIIVVFIDIVRRNYTR